MPVSYVYNAELIRVVDGDSVILLADLGFNTFQKVNVRIMGVDAPERFTEEGKIVTQKVIEWFQKYSEIVLFSEKLDKYGRSLGIIQNAERNSLNDYLLKNWLARPYHGEKRDAWTTSQINAIREQA